MSAAEGRSPRFYARDADAARLAAAIRQRRIARNVAARIDPGIQLARRLTDLATIDTALSSTQRQSEVVEPSACTWPAPTGQPERILFAQWVGALS